MTPKQKKLLKAMYKHGLLQQESGTDTIVKIFDIPEVGRVAVPLGDLMPLMEACRDYGKTL